LTTVWIVEKHKSTVPSIAAALMGDFAVRAIASLESFQKLARLGRSEPPRLVLVDVDDAAAAAERIAAVVREALGDVALALVAHAPDTGSAVDAEWFAKPIDALAMAGAIGSMLRERGRTRVVRYRDVSLDCERFQLCVAGATAIDLPLKEAQLLRLLLEQPERCLGREQICAAIWREVKVAPRTLDSHVSRLRKRLAGAAVTIESVYGGGYVLR
jgi:DNA-binding response OmpR family regulator